jgi:RNA:NAD 2'-phosphotransferase (TPT1/KptA family)
VIDQFGLLQSRRTEVVETMALLGQPLDLNSLEALARRIGSDRLNLLIAPRETVVNWSEVVRSACERRPIELAEVLLLEACIAESPRQVAISLPSRFSFVDALRTVWRAIATALADFAVDVGWKQPLTYVRCLRMEERYLRFLLHESKSGQRPPSESTVLDLCRTVLRQSDFEEVSLRKYRELLDLANGLVNQRRSSPLRVELSLRIHGATGDRSDLLVAAKTCSSMQFESPRDHSLAAEVFFRMAAMHAETSAGAKAFARRSTEHATAVQGSRDSHPIQWIRCLIVKTCNAAIESGLEVPPLLSRSQLPFQLPHAMASVERGDVEARQLLSAVAAELAPRGHEFANPIARRVAAAMLSSMGRWTFLVLSERLEALHQALALRAGGPGHSPLRDDFSRIEQATDHLVMAPHCATEPHRALGLAGLLELMEVAESWPVPFVAMARAADSMEGPLTVEELEFLRGLQLDRASHCRDLLVVGDVAGIYSLAAEQAQASREVDQQYLGGREGVYRTSDYTRVLDNTFVFKRTQRTLAERDANRTSAIRAAVASSGKRRFSVSQTWAICSVADGEAVGEAVAVQEYVDGQPLSLTCGKSVPLNQKYRYLEDAVEFLALIHALEHDQVPYGATARSALRPELGRWLRENFADSEESLFDRLLKRMEDSPLLTKRDAHAGNWLVTDADHIVALDFEAKGWRPAGYEVAQLIDDEPLLPVDEVGWGLRLRLLDTYHKGLSDGGVPCSYSALLRSYRSACIGRAVRDLTDPFGDDSLRSHGEALLNFIAKSAESSEESELALEIMRAWSTQRGRPKGGESGRLLSPGGRVRISRSMSYHLRHGQDLVVDEGGWVYFGALSDQMNRSGVRTTKEELRAVALHPDEPRFEVKGDRVRAIYGHTVSVAIDYPILDERLLLFHGTGLEVLDEIFAKGQLLSPMKRRWVHWSASPQTALKGYARHGRRVLVTADSASFDEVFVASDHTLLTVAVSPELLQLVTPLQEHHMGLPIG